MTSSILQEYIQRRKQLMITELFGTIEYEEDYDYKQQRHLIPNIYTSENITLNQ